MIIMERDPTSPREGYSTKSYIWALEEGLIPNYEGGLFSSKITPESIPPGQHKHGSSRTISGYKDHPAHSPDLNPIEHVWKAMKAILHLKYPDLHLLKDNEADIAVVKAALKDAWAAVPQSLIDRPSRFYAPPYEGSAEGQGWYTKY